MSGEVKAGLFVGIRITAALERHLDESDSSHDYLLEGGNEQSLQRVTIDDDEVLGRPVEQGVTVDSLGDMVRNLKSILLKVCPRYTPKDSEIRVYTRTMRG